MIKNIYPSLSLSIASFLLLTQIGCSTPTQNNTNTAPNSSTANPSVTAPASNTPSTNVQNNNNLQINGKQSSFLLTQKDSKGITNVVVPENIEYVSVNGKIIKAADISITKGSFSTKAVDELGLSFKDGKFVLQGITEFADLNVSFKLKDSTEPVNLPNSTLSKISGDLRVELTRNEAGEVTGFTGGLNKDGAIDTSNTVFSLDHSTQSLIVIQAGGNKTTYALDDVKTELKVTTQAEVQVTNPQQEAEELTGDVTAPNAVSAFVGDWKFTSPIGINVNLSLKDSGSNKIGYSSVISNSLVNYQGTFTGDANYSETSDVNVLNISSAIKGKSIKGDIKLTGDNSLTLVLTSTDVTQIKNFVDMTVTLERDVK